MAECVLSQLIKKLPEDMGTAVKKLMRSSGLKTPVLDTLPDYEESQSTMTYAGIGSRETPPEIMAKMTEIAKKLEELGYTMRSGGAEGADVAFEQGVSDVNSKEIYLSSTDYIDKATGQYKNQNTRAKLGLRNESTDKVMADKFPKNSRQYLGRDVIDKVRSIAKEVHAAPDRLSDYALDLTARNVFQVFGEKLDTPADFILAWTPLNKDGQPVTSHEQKSYDPAKKAKLEMGKETFDTGGTGMAISYASLKGVPVINMADPKWEEQLAEITKNVKKVDRPIKQSNSIHSKLGNKTVRNNVVIANVYQKAGVDYAKSIGGVFSLRVNGSTKHFGNPFSHVPAEIAKGLVATKTTKESVEAFISWVLSDSTNVDPERHEWIRNTIKSGVLKDKPVVYYKELGEPSHATALDYLINEHQWGSINSPVAESESINIYSKDTNGYEGLSNLTVRPFTMQGRTFQSVEHAYQSLKSGTGIEESVYNKDWSKGGLVIRGTKGVKVENNWNTEKLMPAIMLRSFEQNPEATALLLSTGETTLTHNVADKVWKDKFPAILMQIRNRLKNEGNSPKAATTGTVEVQTTLYTREEVKANPKKLYIFGENEGKKSGKNTETIDGKVVTYPNTTQAVIRGLKNALGVFTVKNANSKDANRFYTDSDVTRLEAYYTKLLQKVQMYRDRGYAIVLPANGVGTGKAAGMSDAAFNVIATAMNEIAGYEYMKLRGIPTTPAKQSKNPLNSRAQSLQDAAEIGIGESEDEAKARVVALMNQKDPDSIYKNMSAKERIALEEEYARSQEEVPDTQLDGGRIALQDKADIVEDYATKVIEDCE